MAKFTHNTSSKKRFRVNNKYIKYGLVVLVVLVVALLIERLITQGTFLGYRVRTVESSAVKKSKNNSGAQSGSLSAQAKDTKACELVSAVKLSDATGEEFKTIGSLVPDRTEPNLVSSCIFVAEASKVTVSILLRELEDQQKATKTVDALAKGSDTEQISKLGDQAVYNTSSNQLTLRLGARVMTITVSKSSSEDFDNKQMALQVAGSILK